MKMQTNRSCRRCPTGFTLVELLAVVVIVLVIATLVVSVGRYASRRAEISQTQMLLSKLELAIEAFRLDKGYYPTSSIYRVTPVDYHAEKLNGALLYQQLTGGARKYATFNASEISSNGTSVFVVDAWGTPINYYRPISNVTFSCSGNGALFPADYIDPANYFVQGYDNFTAGGMVNTVSFDLFSYGPDKRTSGGCSGWPGSWTSTQVALDDIWSGRR